MAYRLQTVLNFSHVSVFCWICLVFFYQNRSFFESLIWMLNRKWLLFILRYVEYFLLALEKSCYCHTATIHLILLRLIYLFQKFFEFSTFGMFIKKKKTTGKVEKQWGVSVFIMAWKSLLEISAELFSTFSDFTKTQCYHTSWAWENKTGW